MSLGAVGTRQASSPANSQGFSTALASGPAASTPSPATGRPGSDPLPEAATTPPAASEPDTFEGELGWVEAAARKALSIRIDKVIS